MWRLFPGNWLLPPSSFFPEKQTAKCCKHQHHPHLYLEFQNCIVLKANTFKFTRHHPPRNRKHLKITFNPENRTQVFSQIAKPGNNVWTGAIVQISSYQLIFVVNHLLAEQSEQCVTGSMLKKNFTRWRWTDRGGPSVKLEKLKISPLLCNNTTNNRYHLLFDLEKLSNIAKSRKESDFSFSFGSFLLRYFALDWQFVSGQY